MSLKYSSTFGRFLRLLINKVDNGQGTWEALSANTWFQGTRERDGQCLRSRWTRCAWTVKSCRQFWTSGMWRPCSACAFVVRSGTVDPDNPLDAATEKDYHHWYSEAELGDDDDPVEFWVATKR